MKIVDLLSFFDNLVDKSKSESTFPHDCDLKGVRDVALLDL